MYSKCCLCRCSYYYIRIFLLCCVMNCRTEIKWPNAVIKSKQSAVNASWDLFKNDSRNYYESNVLDLSLSRSTLDELVWNLCVNNQRKGTISLKHVSFQLFIWLFRFQDLCVYRGHNTVFIVLRNMKKVCTFIVERRKSNCVIDIQTYQYAYLIFEPCILHEKACCRIFLDDFSSSASKFWYRDIWRSGAFLKSRITFNLHICFICRHQISVDVKLVSSKFAKVL